MAKNLEVKCRLNNFNTVKKRISEIKGIVCLKEKQVDIYYKVKKGRLKLRIINDKIGNLIFYVRTEKTSRRISNYNISETKSFRELDKILRSQFEVLTIIHKVREIFITDNIRIHLDIVKDLGKFLELEVIYNELTLAKKQIEKVILKLNISGKDFIKASYSDLLINKK